MTVSELTERLKELSNGDLPIVFQEPGEGFCFEVVDIVEYAKEPAIKLEYKPSDLDLRKKK